MGMRFSTVRSYVLNCANASTVSIRHFSLPVIQRRWLWENNNWIHNFVDDALSESSWHSKTSGRCARILISFFFIIFSSEILSRFIRFVCDEWCETESSVARQHNREKAHKNRRAPKIIFDSKSNSYSVVFSLSFQRIQWKKVLTKNLSAKNCWTKKAETRTWMCFSAVSDWTHRNHRLQTSGKKEYFDRALCTMSHAIFIWIFSLFILPGTWMCGFCCCCSLVGISCCQLIFFFLFLNSSVAFAG